jgi:hypothetical protein
MTGFGEIFKFGQYLGDMFCTEGVSILTCWRPDVNLNARWGEVQCAY